MLPLKELRDRHVCGMTNEEDHSLRVVLALCVVVASEIAEIVVVGEGHSRNFGMVEFVVVIADQGVRIQVKPKLEKAGQEG